MVVFIMKGAVIFNGFVVWSSGPGGGETALKLTTFAFFFNAKEAKITSKVLT